MSKRSELLGITAVKEPDCANECAYLNEVEKKLMARNAEFQKLEDQANKYGTKTDRDRKFREMESQYKAQLRDLKRTTDEAIRKLETEAEKYKRAIRQVLAAVAQVLEITPK